MRGGADPKDHEEWQSVGQIDRDDAIELHRESSRGKRPTIEIRLQSFFVKFCPDDSDSEFSVFAEPTVLRGKISSRAFEEAERDRESWQFFFEAKVHPSILREYGYAILSRYSAPYGGYMEPELLELLPARVDRPLTARERDEVEARERFERRLKPCGLRVDAEGGITIEYDVGDLLGGHAVLVSGTLEDGPRECTIEG